MNQNRIENEIPSIGEIIRTSHNKMEGKVEKVISSGNGYVVFFRIQDGRLMKTSLDNVTVIQKLQDENMKKITKESYKIMPNIDTERYQQRSGLEGPFRAKNGKVVYYDPREGKYYDPDSDFYISHEEWESMNETIRFSPVGRNGLEEVFKGPGMFEIYDLKTGQTIHHPFEANDISDAEIKADDWLESVGKSGKGLGVRPSTQNEGSMGGINRSAPAQDVSYEKILDEVMEKWKEEQLNELSVDKMQKYISAAKAAPWRGLSKAKNNAAGAAKAVDKINAKTGNRTGNNPKFGPINTQHHILEQESEIIAKQLNVRKSDIPMLLDLVNGKLRFNDLPQSVRFSLYKFYDGLPTDLSNKTSPELLNRLKKIVHENSNNEFSDILKKQQADATSQKKSVVDIPYHGWKIRYRPSEPGAGTIWMVLDKKHEEKHRGQSMSDEDAIRDAEEWINAGGGTRIEAKKNVTIDFNADFKNQFAPQGETLYVQFYKNEKYPMIKISTEPREGFKRTHGRLPKDKTTESSVPLPAVGLTAEESNSLSLQPNGRYILGSKSQIDNDTMEFPLIFQSIAQSKNDLVRMGKPGFTVAHSRKVDEVYMGRWQGDAEKYAKAPKSTTKGTKDIPLSTLVQDTVEKHGVKWAFNYYVKKNGMPPKHFQIYAGLTANPTKKELQLPDLPKPATPNTGQSEKKSWWKNLIGRLPFEENLK